MMALRTRARRSDEEVLRERLAALPERTRAWLDAPPTDVAHSKPIKAPTEHVHARVRKLWASFVSGTRDPAVREVGAEITPAMLAPTTGATSEVVAGAR